MIWINKSVVLAIHESQLAEHGGIIGIRDEAMLENALIRPQNFVLYSSTKCDLADIAAKYAFGIVGNHPFLDGNKRTAYVVCRLFLKINGKDLNASKEDKVIKMLQLAEGSLKEEAFASWLRAHTH